MAKIKSVVYRLLDAGARDSALERAGNLVLGGLIVLNIIAVVAETVPALYERFAASFAAFEAFSLAVFTVEYVLRVLTCTVNPAFQGSVAGRVRFLLTPMALIDLAAILPAYLPGDLLWDLRYIRVLRLLRMLRILRFARYSQTLKTFGNAFKEKRDELALVAAFLLVLLVLASSSMYFVEHKAQPQIFSSIPAAMWWAVATLTTVGYGDIYPVTPLGKLLGSLIALIGIGFFALPAGLLASAFAEQLDSGKRAGRICPHCGKDATEAPVPSQGQRAL